MYFNEEGKNITKQIIDNRTILIEGTDVKSRIYAREKAKEMRSSEYEVFTKDDKGRLVFIGYGIPK